MATVLGISFLIILIINLLAYCIAYIKQTDHLTDITYNLCFLFLVVVLWIWNGEFGVYQNLLVLMVGLWSIRLGGFLLYRILKMGKDTRFDSFRNSKSGFLKFWLLQAISIWVIALPFMIALSKTASVSMNALSFLALSIWLLGWIMESVADWQKFSFKQNSENKADFIRTGLFTYIRHPNYTGEILCWIAVFLYTFPILTGWENLAIVSPVWIVVLLVSISGIPLIEKAHQRKYGDSAAYNSYLEKSWRLIPYIY